MPVQRSQGDSWTKEMAKWEQRPVLVGDTYIQPIPIASGGREHWPHDEFPKMLYQAALADGGPRITGTRIVHDEAQERIALGQGWSDGQQAALDAVGAQHREFARLAAERHHTERWMSAGAQREAAEVDTSTLAHVPEIPEARKRGRPKKSVDV